MLTPEAAIGEISPFDVLFAQDLFERSPRPPRFCFALFQMVESLLGSSQPEGLARFGARQSDPHGRDRGNDEWP